MLTLLKDTYSLLTDRERLLFFVLVFLSLVSSGVQAIGIGAIFPFLSLLVEPDHLIESPVLGRLRVASGLEEQDFLISLGLVAITLFVLGLLFKFATDIALQKYALGRQHRFGLLLLEQKMEMSYEEYLQRNSSEVITQQTQHLRRYTQQFLSAALRGLSDGILVIAVGVLLIASAPLVALFLGLVIGGGYTLFLLVTGNRMQRMAVTQRNSAIAQTRIVNECMGSFKEMKVLGRSFAPLHSYGDAVLSYLTAFIRFEVLRLLPWLGLQVLIVFTLFGLIVYYIKAKGDAREVVALLGFFGLATKQLIPGMTGVFAAVQSMKQVRPIAEDITQALLGLKSGSPQSMQAFPKCPDSDSRPSINGNHHITLDQVSFRYAQSEDDVINGIDLEIPRNSSVAFVGSTGSGKTTLVDLIIGLLPPREGSILIGGHELNHDSETLTAWQRKIGYVPQSIFLADATVRENIAFGLPPGQIDEDLVRNAAGVAQIHEFIVNELASGYDTLVGENGIRLSGGQRQRLGIARALYHRPDVIVLDEATSALDNQTERNLTEAIESLGQDHTLIIVAHRLTTVKKCDQVVMLVNGAIRSKGTFDDLMSTCPEFRQLASLVEK